MKSFLKPESVLKKLKLKSDMRAADFGSGSGGWVIPLAKILEDGKVFAIDILEEPLSALKSKLKSTNIDNIETIQSSVEILNGSKLFPESCDLILMTNLLFQTEDKEVVLGEGERVLNSGGKILVIDWKENVALGPKERISAKEVIKIVEKIGMKVEKEFEASPCHWGLILIK
ncbi:MAG: class I SAM-dependent methyltransferase [Patescibacteria group bacterium]|nr:class I SAM-dependent methyltransferase [Patescibacteria group bacterium]MBU1877145.1 class I SAM-dependent methyltransferase [Patescibacteria group bacterium]